MIILNILNDNFWCLEYDFFFWNFKKNKKIFNILNSKCKEFGANIYLYGNNIGLNSDK